MLGKNRADIFLQGQTLDALGLVIGPTITIQLANSRLQYTFSFRFQCPASEVLHAVGTKGGEAQES